MKRRTFLKRSLIFLGLLLVFVYFNNASWLAKPPASGPLLLAHRGMSQTFDLAGVGNDTDTSKRIHPPEHPYLENTIASMEAAFRHGADVVEFDIHPTTDGRFAVFHDWTLDYRTDGKGVTREHSLAELQRLLATATARTEERPFLSVARASGSCPRWMKCWRSSRTSPS